MNPPNPIGWTPLGPSCMYNGQLTRDGQRAPVSGRCTSIVVHPTDPKTVYIGTATGGVWVTADAGLTWTPIMDDQICLAVGAMVLDPSNPNRLYVATGEGNAGGEILPGAGLLVYTVSGTPGWELRPQGSLVGRHIAAIVVDASTAPFNKIWLATDQGLLASTDDGQTFNTLAVGAANAAVSDLVYNKFTKTLYAALWGDGVYQSVNGAAFTRFASGAGGLATGSLGRIGLGICETKPIYLYASFADTKGGFIGIYTSPNGGSNWSPCNLPQPAKDLRQGNYNHFLRVDPATETTVLFGEAKLWRSTDSGQSWTDVSGPHAAAPGIHSDQHALAISPSDSTQVWSGNDGGVWYSIDSGVSFFHRNRGLQTMQFYALALHPDDASIMVGGAQDNGSQRYEGHPAADLTTFGDGFFCAIDPAEPWRWYAAYTFLDPKGKITAIQRNESAGDPGSWKYIVSGITNTFPSGQNPFYVPFVIDPTNHQVLYLGTNNLYRTENLGDSWTPIYTDPNTKAAWVLPTASYITAIAVNPWDGTRVYAGTRDGNVFAMVRQADGSFTVTQLAGLPAGELISDIAVAPPVAPAKTSNLIYVGVGSTQLSGDPINDIAAGRIFSRDAVSGANWQPLKAAGLDRTFSGAASIPHTRNPVNAIAVDPGNPNTVYIGCNSGVFRSTDRGTSWTLYSDNLPNVAIGDLQFHAKTKLLRAATIGRSVWEIKTDDTPAPSPLTANIYIRRNILDVGRDSIPVPADAIDPLDPGHSTHITPLTGADIKIDTPFLFSGLQDPASHENYTDPTTPADYIAFPQFDTSNRFRHSATSRVYAEVMNRGPAPATNVIVRAFYASKTGNTYPQLPADFWTKFPNADPDMSTWKKFGDAITLGTIPPAQPKVAKWELQLPTNTPDPVGVLVVATSTEDPAVKSPAAGILDPNVLAKQDRHVAIREASIGLGTAEVVAIIIAAVGIGVLVGVGAYLGTKH